MPNPSEELKTARVPYPSKLPRRLPKRITQGEAVTRAELFVARNLPRYLAVLEQMAMGVFVMGTLSDGQTIIVYQKLLNRQVLQYLVDRGMGKAPQRYEVTGGGGGPMQIAAWQPSGDEQTNESEVMEGEFTELDALPEPSEADVPDEAEDEG